MACGEGVQDRFVETELETLVIALSVKIDGDAAGIVRLPGRPPKLSHAELICLAVVQAMLGYHSEARWLRYARTHLRHLLPFMPLQPGYNKRLRAVLPQIKVDQRHPQGPALPGTTRRTQLRRHHRPRHPR